MAKLSAPVTPWSARQIRSQWAAVGRLRWRIFRNNLARKSGRGDLIAALILYPLFAALFALPVAAAGVGAFSLAHNGQLERLSWLLWAVFLLGQFVNINLGQPGTTFDPNQLIRFPLALRQFLLLRLFFGLLSPANVLVLCMGAAIAVGLGAALPRLWPFTGAALLIFTATNVLFSRMVFAWVDRWLSTRRAREVFTALVFVASLAFQYVNISVNTGYTRRHAHSSNLERWHAVSRTYDRARPLLALLPPELTAHSLQDAQGGRLLPFAARTVGSGLFGLAFLCVFALRMRTEFRGEALSDSAVGGTAALKAQRTVNPARVTGRARNFQGVGHWLSPTVRAVLAKELLYTRRNSGVFYSLLAPLAMVFLFAGRLATRNSTPWVFPAALAYTLIGVLPLSFNSFGFEGAGVQFYFLAPVRLRDVVMAKNLLGFALAALEAAITIVVIVVSVGMPSLHLLLSCLLWAAAALLFGTSLGNRRALAAPKQIKLNKSSGKQASPASALMSLGVLLLCALFGVSVLVMERRFHLPWLSLALFAGMFGIALAVYLRTLRGTDSYALHHREELFAELCKA